MGRGVWLVGPSAGKGEGVGLGPVVGFLGQVSGVWQFGLGCISRFGFGLGLLLFFSFSNSNSNQTKLI